VVKRDGRLVGIDLAHARKAIEDTVSYAERTLGDEKWTSGMHPEIPETRILENPYQYTEWDAGAAQWKR
jgi:5-methylthioadenosine/S-adenosylhomocysteine deaminase